VDVTEVMRLVAAGLAAGGVDVRADGPGGGEVDHVVIVADGGRCELTVDERGRVQWDYRPRSADPKLIADMATTLLTGQGRDLPRLGDGYERPGVRLKGVVGSELRARGLDVELGVYTDERFFEAYSEIIATNPGDGQDGEVCVNDGGQLLWTRDFAAGPEDAGSGPELANAEELAAEVVAAVLPALAARRARPGT
jgi:hypothetical protein